MMETEPHFFDAQQALEEYLRHERLPVERPGKAQNRAEHLIMWLFAKGFRISRHGQFRVGQFDEQMREK
jgi:hypothetical protein